MGWNFQWMNRVQDWIDAHPEFEDQVTDWQTKFRCDPLSGELEGDDCFDSQHGDALMYPVPSTPLVVVVVIEKEEDEDGERWVSDSRV